jgi:hypothetical protein
MNVRLIYELDFAAGIWYNSNFYVNNYSVKLNLVTNTLDGAEHNIALARLKYFAYEVMENSVLINFKNQDQRKKLAAAGLRVIALPEEPVDQILGMALCCKFNAIMQGRMIITDLDISSEQGDNVVYCHNVQEVSGPLEQSGWWHDTEPVYAEHTVNRNQRVIAINRDVKWHDLDLGWEPKEESKESDIVVTSFKRDDK